ncbi:hypothetical protein J8L85_07220 [Maribacter sp. MMG018]|uniref:hypothetical protein n=1 Tax=Maribacter sp. MMG018 TaxID=2822688 RepID=UPI001B393E78|nr:hypothetical protein [Maribacter sp. MMG018]MBQ4914220.1 hypothetical protein [Maribacter sp. MMG018]
MIALILSLTFLGFYLCYSTSKRQEITNTLKIESWGQQHSFLANICGSMALLASCTLSIIRYGWGSGIFTFSIILMTIASLIILLQPLKLITYKTVSVVLASCLICEFLLF